MSGIYISTGAFRGGRLLEMAEAAESIGAGLELSSGVRWHPAMEEEIEEVLIRRGRVLVHNYFPPPREPFVLNLASVDPITLERSREHVRQAIDMSAQCGAPFYSVHSGFAMNLKAEHLGKPEAQAQMQRVPYWVAHGLFLDSVRELSAYGKSRGVRLLIENNVITREQVEAKGPLEVTHPGEFIRWMQSVMQKEDVRMALEEFGRPDPGNRMQMEAWMRVLKERYPVNEDALPFESPLLMIEPAEIAFFLRQLNDSNVGLLLDVGHAKVTAGAMDFDPARYFEELAPWIGAVHLSDNDGERDNNRAFGRDAWFAEYYFGEIPIVVEVYGIGIEGAREMVDVVNGWRG